MPLTLGEAPRLFATAWMRDPLSGALTRQANSVVEWEFADLTAVSPIVSFGSPGVNYLRAVVNFKTYTGGVAPSLIMLQMADDPTITTNVRTPAILLLTTAAYTFTVVLEGVCPDGPKRYGRLVFGAGDGTTAVFDAIVCGSP